MPTDLTDINPTIISTDTEDDDYGERSRQKKRKTRHLSFKNPVVNISLISLAPVRFFSVQPVFTQDALRELVVSYHTFKLDASR